MSLSNRDKFVRYLDPLEIIWEDADGNIHISGVNACRAFNVTPTQKNIAIAMEKMKEVVAQVAPHAKMIERKDPDSPEYFNQLPPSQ